MRTTLVALALGFLVSVLLTPIARRFGARKLLDVPEDARRLHARPIPRTGGLAIAAGVLAPILGLAVYENQNLISQAIYRDTLGIITLLLGAVLALGLGLLDDIYKVSANKRLVALFGIAMLEWVGGHRIEAVTLPLAGELNLGFFAFPVTCLWIVGMIVAFNFIDGLDGLAAGIALIGTMTMLWMGFSEGNLLWMAWSGAIVGALLGFLCFNFNPASIFMGDSGSNFLGFLMALVSMETSRKQQTAVALFVPALALGLPILDAALTMVRRSLHREGLFLSDRGHIYHRLHDRGLSQRHVALVLYGCAVAMSLSGLALMSNVPALSLFGAALIAIVVFGIMLATGYVRLEDVRLMYRRGIENRARIRSLEQAVESTIADMPIALPIRTRTAWAVARLIGDYTGVTAATYERRGGERLVWGKYSQRDRGVWSSFQLVAEGDALELKFFWRDRDSGPSQAEVVALRSLVASLGRAPGPLPTHTDVAGARRPGGEATPTSTSLGS